jgi:hypothetical protein
LKNIVLIFLFSLLVYQTKAQLGPTGPNDTIPVYVSKWGIDSFAFFSMQTIAVSAPMPKHLSEQKKEWTRLRNAVYVTYPYAINGAYVFNDINRNLKNISSNKERKKYIKTREKELKREFTDKIKNLSVYQGKVLMKIIYRETGEHCYDIIKEMKSGATARLWQTVAFFFGGNLKQSYEPLGKDAEMEEIVKEVARMYGRS